jgi:kinesin family protein 15
VTYALKASYLEIYNERPYDLLEPDAQNLNIREDTKKGVYVENLQEVFFSRWSSWCFFLQRITELPMFGHFHSMNRHSNSQIPVNNATDALRLAILGAQNRRVASTAMNRESSRSHALFCLTISSKVQDDSAAHKRLFVFDTCCHPLSNPHATPLLA